MKKIPVSINLSVVCRRVIELFQRFDQHADYLGPSSAHETLQKLALYRYEVLWLPLAAAHKLYAGAPVDVHWIWLAHMLDPLAYRQDCQRVIELFQRFDQHADYLGPSSAHETLQKLALYRYEVLWLPLAAAHKLYAGAPVDVHWIWLAHMLDPLAYRQDCQRMVGKLIEHKLVSNKKLKQMTDKARAMWQLHYPKEPFDFNTGRIGFGHLLEKQDHNLWNWSKIASGDLLTIARCHQHFFYQVSLPHFMQADHLKEAEQRYRQFVHLKRIQHQYQQWHNHGMVDFAQSVANQARKDDSSMPETSNSISEPLLSCLPFDIELCWRAHLFHPRVYARDMSCLFGKLLHHPCQPYRFCMLSRLDDTLFAAQFRNGTKERVCSLPRIDQLWTTCFPDQPLDKSGCLDRGISTRNRLKRLSSVDIYRIATKYAQVSLNSVVAQLHPTPDKFAIKIQHIGQLHGDHDSTNGNRQVAKLNSPGCVWNAVDPGKPIARFTVISGVQDELTIQLIDKRGWFCPSNSLLGLATVSLQRAIESFRETVPVDYELSSEFEGLDKQPSSKPKLTSVTEKETSDSGLSHIFAQRKTNLCQTLLSTIKKDVTEDMVCSNTDALPRNSFGMTYSAGLGLHPLREERAMIVKDADGDWCIVIGHWSGFQRFPAPEMADSSTECTPEKSYLNFSTTHGSGGHLSLRMHWLKVNERKVTCAQVLCQPRIINQEGCVHKNIPTTSENGRSTNNLKPTESCMTKLSTLGDLESPSVITSSTSFESAVCQVGTTQSDSLPVNDTPEKRCARTLFTDVWKTEWVVAANATKEWTSEIMQLNNPSFRSKNQFDICCEDRTVSQDPEKPVEVVGMVYLQSVRHGNSTGDKTVTPRVQVALFKPIKEFVSCMQQIETKQNARSSLSKFNATPPPTRGLMDSLTYVMCLGVGHPVDTLIPSIQFLRQLQRAEQLSHLSHLNIVDSYQVDTFNGNGVKTKDETMKPYDDAHNSFSYSLHRIIPEEHGNNISRSVEHNSFDTSWHTPPVNTSNEIPQRQSNLEQPHATFTKLSRSAFNGWRLSDFYDYFLLELPDVCSGCVYGCQFCNGLGIL
ncbi:hypothetical protein EG68_02001 [Paragonimus skrjabini miyazakii]|uniref:Uncharacterized protein n=1 Tax=Paragonimus skrjabini miyazakii TaxID=59628 RepID=A0A8S9Z024_9TREM|nr:hypothetical protein EG68_02001 [Paragonimus skrjabini miyazakii]